MAPGPCAGAVGRRCSWRSPSRSAGAAPSSWWAAAGATDVEAARHRARALATRSPTPLYLVGHGPGTCGAPIRSRRRGWPSVPAPPTSETWCSPWWPARSWCRRRDPRAPVVAIRSLISAGAFASMLAGLQLVGAVRNAIIGVMEPLHGGRARGRSSSTSRTLPTVVSRRHADPRAAAVIALGVAHHPHGRAHVLTTPCCTVRAR